MPVYYSLKNNALLPAVLIGGSLPLPVQVAALQDAVTQLQKQVTSLQTMMNMMQQAAMHGFYSSGLATFEILAEPGMSNVIIPFFDT